ncbi:hypothetical protein HIM_02686 [Hirsutella minnesotensis 3608]|nr:hypothetical protein HIM_02686 [Hirsutella minnesotensis 3608]
MADDDLSTRPRNVGEKDGQDTESWSVPLAQWTAAGAGPTPRVYLGHAREAPPPTAKGSRFCHRPLILRAGAYVSPVTSEPQRSSPPPLPTPRTAPSTRAAPTTATATTSRRSAWPQHEPGSVQYLARLLRLAQCRRPDSDMADFLASFNFGAEDAALPKSSSCASIEELQLRLHDVLSDKSTPTRAQHVATTLDLGEAAQLAVSLSAAEATSPRPWARPTAALGDSVQQWERENKGKAKAVIGEYLSKEMDPILMSRPAFDCRGTIKISLLRGSRAVSVKYDHTPLHKTVGEVAELFKPPPRPTVTRAPEKQKTPKKPGSARKKREYTKALDENGNPRKRKRSKTEGAQSQAAGQSQGQQPLSEMAPNTQGSLQVSDAPAAQNPAAETIPMGPGPPQTTTGGSFPLNLAPEEALRRREAAIKLLTEAGVDPDTLSTEQFNIFANQSPELQKESLNMLVKYGAERLRIVHPSNRDGSASTPTSATTTPTMASGSAASQDTTTTELGPPSAATAQETPKSAKGSRRKGPSKSRIACFQCKDRRVKCPKELPTCAECQTAGTSCEYASRPKAKKESKSEAIVPADYDAEDDSQFEQEAEQVPAQEPVEEQPQMNLGLDHLPPEEEEEAQEDDSQEDAQKAQSVENGEEPGVEDTSYSSYPQMPVADMLGPTLDMQNDSHQPMQQSQAPYFRSASGLALPQPEEPPVVQMHPSTSGLVLPQSTVQYPSHTSSMAADASSLVSRSDEAAQMLAAQQAQQAQQAPKSSRRSLPTVPPQRQSHTDSPVQPTGVSGWASSVNQSPQLMSTAMATASSHTRNGSDSRRQDHRQIDSPQMQEAMALSQAALDRQRQAQAAPMMMQASAQSISSNSADEARAKSRQGQRAQTKTPRGMQSAQSAYEAPPPPEPTMNQSSASNQYRSGTMNISNAQAYGNYNRYSDTLQNTSSSDRVGYEPYSYQRSSQGGTTYSSYDYGRSPATTISMEDSDSMTTMASAYPSSGSVNMPDTLAAVRARNNVPNRTSSPYNNQAAQNARQRPVQGQPSTASPEYNLRTASMPQPTRPAHTGPNTHLQQQQQQSQRHHSQSQSHRRQPQHQPHQQLQRQSQTTQQHQPQAQSQQSHQGQQGWYGFGETGDSSYPFDLQRSNYNWKMPDEPWGGVS